MANIMNLKTIRNKTSKNGFDLSFKKNFSAKVGELLPIMTKEVYPGDYFEIDLKSLVRTKPLNTAAFGRIREYYDFFFVPYNLLWNKSDTVFTQMLDNPQHSTDFNPATRVTLSGNMPHLSMQAISAYISQLNNNSTVDDDTGRLVKKNYFGYSRTAGTCKLLEYLGYGNYYPFLDPANSNKQFQQNLNMNIFGMLAYQKIYADFFRDSQWELINPSTFNVDWITGQNDVNLTTKLLTNFSSMNQNYNMFDLRYCNWQKDMFHGVVPNSQYGSESVYPLDFNVGNYGYYQYTDVNGTARNGVARRSTAQSDSIAQLSILKLRQYEFLQKWKEIAQTAGKDYKDQINKHWDTNVGDYASELSQYLGGTSSTIDINEVVNTNITGDNGADIAGKGYGVSNGKITFDSNGRYGMLMCIYHAIPMIDYITDSINPAYTKINATDFAIPEFDRVGMQVVPMSYLNNSVEGVDDVSFGGSPNLGYAPRYIDLKTSIDESVGSLKRTDSHWIIGYSKQDLLEQFSNFDSDNASSTAPQSGALYYTFFKVNPNSVDDIFAVSADDSLSTDQLLCSSYFDIKAVRALDTDGLPY